MACDGSSRSISALFSFLQAARAWHTVPVNSRPLPPPPPLIDPGKGSVSRILESIATHQESSSRKSSELSTTEATTTTAMSGATYDGAQVPERGHSSIVSCGQGRGGSSGNSGPGPL